MPFIVICYRQLVALDIETTGIDHGSDRPCVSGSCQWPTVDVFDIPHDGNTATGLADE
jgi:hypothetical protein